MGGVGGSGPCKSEESFLFVPPHRTVNTLRTIQVIHVLDLHHAGFTVLLAQAGGSITEACLIQGAPEMEPVISLLLVKDSPPFLEPWGFTPTSLQSKSQVLSDFGIGYSFVMTLQNKTQREKTEEHRLCCSNSLIS